MPKHPHKPHRHRLTLESLEPRHLLSAALQPTPLADSLSTHLLATQLRPIYQFNDSPFKPLATVGPTGYSPAEIRTAYGLSQLSFGSVSADGAGQTIAIIDAYNDPTIRNDLHAFDLAFNIPDPAFGIISQTGSTTALPPVDPVGPGGSNFEGEEALDVEWAHALAPKANILLVEANDASPSNLFAAVDFARKLSGVSVISMSFGGSETASELQYDPFFTTPAGHNGVTFIASTGDAGAPAGYPSYSLNVLATGGTSLSLDANGNYQSEIGWSGSGGGASEFEPKPSYQSGLSNSSRTTPDVAFDADPRTGVAVYDSYNNGAATPWEVLGGTSVAAPAWSGFIAVADQGRNLAGKDTLDSRSGTLPLIYAAPASDFHDITAGNNGFAAAPGYDLVTGRGSPIANLLVSFLVSGNSVPVNPNPGASIASISASSSTIVEGTPLVLTANGVSDPGGTGISITFYEESNGAAGLQTGAGGDFAFTAVTDGSNSITLDTSGVTGTFTFYAQLTDAAGTASPAGTNAPSTTVTVLAPSATGPTIATITATPNPVVTGSTLVLKASNITDPQATVRRVTFYEESNGTPGLQTGIGGDFAFRATSSANNFSISLDTSGVTGDFTFYAAATDALGNGSATGTLAPSVTVTVLSNGVPAQPSALAAFAVSPDQIDLAFNEPASDQTGFSIERALDANFSSVTRVFSINRPDALTYSDTSLAPNTRYFYRVAAVNEAGLSPFSNTAAALTPANRASPIGTVDTATPATLAGWALDTDTPGSSVTVQLLVDGNPFATTTASLPRPDLTPIFNSPNHGFSFDLSSLTPGLHRLDLFAFDTTTQSPYPLHTLELNTNRAPLGAIDRFDGKTLAGWAFDPDAAANPIDIRYTLENNDPALAAAADVRTDLQSSFNSDHHGFSITLPPLTAGPHTVTVFAVDSTTDALTPLGTRAAIIPPPAAGPALNGEVEVATTTRIAGWALDASAPNDPIRIRIDVDGTIGTPTPATLARPDVSTTLHTPAVGFDLPLTLPSGEHRVDLFAIDAPTNTAVLLASRIIPPSVPANIPADADGSLDHASQSTLQGWAWSNLQSPATPPTIRIDIDNIPTTPAPANLPRPDLSALLGPGNFGFSLATPALTPGPHTATLYLLDPLTLTPTRLATLQFATA